MGTFISRHAQALAPGDLVRVESQTLWGWETQALQVAHLYCECDTHMIYFELRQGACLRHIMRADPKQEFKVLSKGADIVSIGTELMRQQEALTRCSRGEGGQPDSGAGHPWWEVGQ